MRDNRGLMQRFRADVRNYMGYWDICEGQYEHWDLCEGQHVAYYGIYGNMGYWGC